MSNVPENQDQPSRSHELGHEVGTREERKIQARRSTDRTLWFGLGMFGVIGWSVALPALLGVGLGIWLDRTLPGGRFSWALALLLAGVALGCMNAWYWINREREAMEQNDRESRS